MEKRILFISKYKDIIQEFLDAMQGKNIEIQTAQNGVEAATLLKKNEYQIVITGLTMEGYNGEQLISYVNRAHPNTVCIIYTTTISVAQLHFFINKRDVFRVFLRPVDFRKDFFETLEEAFEYYAVKKMNAEENVEKIEQTETYRKQIAEFKEKIEAQENAKIGMVRYMKRLVKFTLKEYADHLTKEEWKRLEGFEGGLIELACGGENSLTKAEMAVNRLEEVMYM